MFQNPFQQPAFAKPFQNISAPQVVKPSEQQVNTRVPSDFPRFLNYVADYGGCGFWRIIWPEYLLNASEKCMVHTSTCMTIHAQHYSNVKAIKIQRQASTQQKEFVKHLKNLSEQIGFRLIYDIDDIPFIEDIPHYNKHRVAFSSDEIRNNIQEIMEMCGNMTVTCPFMKDYFQSKLDSSVKIDVIPNYIPKFWMGNFYNREKIENNYTTYKKKPRICWSGSGAHFDVEKRIKGKDDFYHINDVVRKTVDKYQWVFYGGISHELIDLVRNGKVEFIPWSTLFNYPERLYTANINMFIAPLSDNNFNKSKSDLKYLEASTLGIPIACQDICTYENAPIKFKTGDEMIDQINNVLSDEGRFIRESVNGRNFAETRFLETESNYLKFFDSYMYEQGDPNRKYLKP